MSRDAPVYHNISFLTAWVRHKALIFIVLIYFPTSGKIDLLTGFTASCKHVNLLGYHCHCDTVISKYVTTFLIFRKQASQGWCSSSIIWVHGRSDDTGGCGNRSEVLCPKQSICSIIGTIALPVRVYDHLAACLFCCLLLLHNKLPPETSRRGSRDITSWIMYKARRNKFHGMVVCILNHTQLRSAALVIRNHLCG